MRLVGQAKLGFYPADPTAIDGILKHLKLPPDPSQVRMLDPCAGEGLAAKQLAVGLGIPADRRYAIELDAARGDKVRENLGAAAHVLAPASYMGCKVAAQTYGLVYCNPPFDDELGGGGRQEETFAKVATSHLTATHGGILVLVMPENAIIGKQDFQKFLDSNYEDAQLYRLPDEVRKFRELVYIARRRKRDIPTDWHGYMLRLVAYRIDKPLPVIGTGDKAWTVPGTWAPHTFVKRQMTEAEMVEAVESSPLLATLKPPKEAAKARPPLPLYKGHVALLLASGLLDGVVHPTDAPAHVVRGTARKITFLADKTEAENPETGAITEKETWSQKIELSVRAVEQDGTIHTFEGEKPEAA